MQKTHAVTKDGLTRRAFLNAGLALAITICGGAFGVVSVAGGAEGSAKGKTVGYITFGLQFEYQVAMVEGIKKKAAEAGLVMQIVDGKGDPNLQVTEVLDAVSKKPAALLINPIDAKLVVAGVKHANEANIPVFIMENAPPEGKYLGFVYFDNEAGGAMGADALAKLIGENGTALQTRSAVGYEAPELRRKGFTERPKRKCRA